MTSTQKGSIDGVAVKTYREGTEHDLSYSAGARSLARAFVAVGMALEVIECVIASRLNNAEPGVQIDSQGLEPIKAIESAPENKMLKRNYNRKDR